MWSLRYMVVAAVAIAAVDGFSVPSASGLARVMGSGRVSSACALRMQDDSAVESDAPPLSRKAKREAARMAKKNTSGKQRQMTQNAGGVRSSAGKTNVEGKLVEVAQLSDLEEEGSTKAVEMENPNGGEKRAIMLLKSKGNVLAAQVGCTKCKLPLMGADITDSSIRCKLCGSTWKLPSGEVAESSEGTMMAGLFKSTEQTNLGVYATKVMGGKVYLGIAK
mmetsp:Transcript_45958/g.115238  ORF Transcript_45958/g.115238 Transcript_45958/m.115238 type:complete len:221 (+) Transcript_45958:31-693(+)